MIKIVALGVPPRCELLFALVRNQFQKVKLVVQIAGGYNIRNPAHDDESQFAIRFTQFHQGFGGEAQRGGIFQDPGCTGFLTDHWSKAGPSDHIQRFSHKDWQDAVSGNETLEQDLTFQQDIQDGVLFTF